MIVSILDASCASIKLSIGSSLCAQACHPPQSTRRADSSSCQAGTRHRENDWQWARLNQPDAVHLPRALFAHSRAMLTLVCRIRSRPVRLNREHEHRRKQMTQIANSTRFTFNGFTVLVYQLNQ